MRYSTDNYTNVLGSHTDRVQHPNTQHRKQSILSRQLEGRIDNQSLEMQTARYICKNQTSDRMSRTPSSDCLHSLYDCLDTLINIQHPDIKCKYPDKLSRLKKNNCIDTPTENLDTPTGTRVGSVDSYLDRQIELRIFSSILWVVLQKLSQFKCMKF